MGQNFGHYPPAPTAELDSKQDLILPRQDAQSSNTLLSSVVAPNFALTGQETPVPGRVDSLTSTNNFINFCSTVSVPLTDGKQVTSGSCNPAPMGHIPPPDSIPSAKFTAPRNGDIIEENTSFSLAINTRNVITGVSVNTQTNFFAAPQQLSDGSVRGNYHLVIEEITSIDQPTLTNPRTFTFFQLLLDPTVASVVRSGLPAGFYRATATVHAANSQPVLVPMHQHGSLNDAVYFTVVGNSRVSQELNDWSRRDFSPSIPKRRKGRRHFKRQGNSPDQASRTLNSDLVCPGFADDGQSTPLQGQSPSLTSNNNFINYCATLPGVPITNGQQLPSTSCNPAPMGLLPSTQSMPSARFIFPVFNATVTENTPFTVTLAVGNLEAGNFVNPTTNFLAAPQQLSLDGLILGYSSIVVEQMSSINQASPTDPRNFVFFKSLTSAAVNNQLTTEITGGLPAGVYRLSSIVSAANHQPVLSPVNQRGAVDDIVYFFVEAANNGSSSNTGLSSTSSTPSTPTATPSQSDTSIAAARTPPVGLIAGVSVAGVVLLLAIILGLFIWRRRHMKKQMEDTFEQPYAGFTPFTDGSYVSFHSAPTIQAAGHIKAGVGETTSLFPLQSAGSKVEGPRPRNAHPASRGSIISSAPSYHTTVERSTLPSD